MDIVIGYWICVDLRIYLDLMMRFCGLLFVESDLLKHIDEKCPFLPHLLHVLYRLRLQSFVRCPFAPQRVHYWVGGFDDD